MMRMAQSEIHDQAAAYALDALDPEDRWTYERHLDNCDRCREEVATLRDIAGELAYGADGPEPSPDLRERILEAARTEPRTATVVPMRRRWLFPATAAAAVAAAYAFLVGAVWYRNILVKDTYNAVLNSSRSTASTTRWRSPAVFRPAPSASSSCSCSGSPSR